MKTDKTEKNVRAVRCSVYTPSRLQGIAILCKRKRKKHSHSLVNTYDLSMNDRASGDLPNERLAIECLPTSSSTMTKKKTKTVLRSTFSNIDSAIPAFVEVLGPMCFSAWSSYLQGF